MESKIKKGTTICFFGARKNIGTSLISLNLSVDLVKRNYKVVYGNSFESDKDYTYMLNEISFKHESEIAFAPSKIEGLKLMSFTKEAAKMSPQKIEELVVGLPEKVSEQGDFFLFNVNDPFNFPDRYILLNTDIHIIVAKVESTIFSDIFQQLEKLAFLPNKPSQMCIIFNSTRDIDRAFETYHRLVKQAEELRINIQIYFLGILPNDILRQNISARLEMPLRQAFPDSPYKGAISFISDKIIRLAQNGGKTGESYFNGAGH